jgi:tripartite-type tricarboxylate transporter receptor subunit TctC
MRRNTLKLWLLGTAAVCWGLSVQAADALKIIVPFAAGGPADQIARIITPALSTALGKPVVVDNRGGAGGTVGTGQVAKAAPDGNTLVLSAASHTLAGHLYPKLAYDPIKDFVGVSLIGYSGYVIAAPSNLGVNNLAEYVRLLKSKPGQTNYASAGNGSATHLGMASFLAKAGVEMQHIPMKSTGDAVNEVLAGRVQGVTSATIGVVGYRQDPRIKLLAYTGPQRSKYLPDVPTVTEAGVSGYRFDSWLGVLAPSATPAAEVQRLNAAIQKAIADPAVQERLSRLGVEQNSASVSSEEFQKILRADWDTAGQIVKASGARLE